MQVVKIEKVLEKKNITAKTITEITMRQSLVVGLIQSLSIIPGVSRSAASIFGAMVVGVDRKTAVEFSFLLAIPTMVAATGLDLVKSSFSFTSGDYQLLAIGFISAFVTALLAVKAFLQFIKSNTFIPFAWYRIILSIIFALFFLK